MALDPRRLLVLAAVRRAGGVLAAGRVLHLTPSAVSQQIARLEAETSAALLDRSRAGGGRPAVLTAAGELLAARGERLAALLAETERDLAALTGALRGAVRVGAFPTAIRRLVAPAVAALGVSHPALVPQVVETGEAAGCAALRAGELDVLLVESDSRQPAPSVHAPPDSVPAAASAAASAQGGAAMGELPLLTDPFHLVVPVTWPPPDDIAQLLTRPWVVGPDGSASRRALHHLARDRGLPDPPAAHQALEYPAVLALVGAGLGAALVPALALQQTPHPGVRTAVPALTVGARTLTAVSRTHGTSPAVEAVLTALLQAAQP